MIRNNGNFLSYFLTALISGLIGFFTFSLFAGEAEPNNLLFYESNSNNMTTPAIEHKIFESRQNAITYAASNVEKAVVTLSVIQKEIVTAYARDFFTYFYQPYQYEKKLNSLGSGFLINEEGYVLTNEHLVENAVEITVTLANGKSYQGKLIGTDPLSDIAVVKIEGEQFPYVTLGNSDDLIIGEWSIAIGNPFGYIINDPKPSVTVGVISAVNRTFRAGPNDTHIYRNMIQTDAAINPGNSGGPLINSKGEVIGINTFIFTKSGGSLGIGFATPINFAKKIAKELIDYGKIRDIYLGIHVQDLNRFVADKIGVNKHQGLIITKVDENSPAYRVGIKEYDIIIAINGYPIRNYGDVREALFDVRSEGSVIEFEILRGNRTLKFIVQAELKEEDK